LAAKKGIDRLTLLRSVNVAWSSTRCELEGHPIEYGLILGSPYSIFSAVSKAAPRGPLLDISTLTCTELREFGGLSGWRKSALIIDRYTGKIEGVLDLNSLKAEDPYEYISSVTNSICIVAKQAFSVRIYYDGRFQVQYIFNRKGGAIEERRLEQIVSILAKQGIEKKIAVKMSDVCLRISEMRRGSLILLGPLTEPGILSQAALNAVSKHISEDTVSLPLSTLIRYATEDGGTWINERGLVIGYGLTFVGPGGRHAIANYVTSKTGTTVAIVVSQDGEIKIFYRNKVKRLASQIQNDYLFIDGV